MNSASSPPTDNAARAVSVRPCGACDRPIVGALGEGGTCTDCGASICMACWRIDGRRTCRTHEQVPASTPAVGGEPSRRDSIMRPERPKPDVLRGVPVRDQATALHYAARFEQKLSVLKDVPGLAERKRVPRWQRRGEHLVVPAHRVPRIRVVRSAAYRAGAERGAVGIEVGLLVLAPRETAVQDSESSSQSVPAASLTELVACLDAAVARADRRAERLVLGLASVAGWDDEAIALVAGDGRRGGWIHPRVTVVLVDLPASAALVNAGDPVAAAWRVVFEPPLPNEIIGEVVERIVAMIEHSGRDHLALRDLVETGLDETIAIEAIQALSETPGWQLDEVSGVGTVIVQTAHGGPVRAPNAPPS